MGTDADAKTEFRADGSTWTCEREGGLLVRIAGTCTDENMADVRDEMLRLVDDAVEVLEGRFIGIDRDCYEKPALLWQHMLHAWRMSDFPEPLTVQDVDGYSNRLEDRGVGMVEGAKTRWGRAHCMWVGLSPDQQAAMVAAFNAIRD